MPSSLRRLGLLSGVAAVSALLFSGCTSYPPARNQHVKGVATTAQASCCHSGFETAKANNPANCDTLNATLCETAYTEADCTCIRSSSCSQQDKAAALNRRNAYQNNCGTLWI